MPLRILLVEDSPMDATLVTRELRRIDAAMVVERVDTAAALRTALAAGAWDAVVSDWSLPGFDALAALAMVRAAHPDLPFVIASGTVGEELAVEAMRAGANDYVLKDKLARLAPAIEREIREAKLREAHRRSEARFRAVIEKGAEAVLLTSEDGTISYASPASTPICGLYPEELFGRRFAALLHADDRVFAARILERLRAERTIGVPIECRGQRADGSVRWIAVTGTNLLDDPAVGAVVVNLRDVTERRRSAAALRASEARFARLAESGIICVVTADMSDKILDANDAYLELIGYPRADLVAGVIRWRDLIPADQEDVIAGMVAQLAERGVAPPAETVALRKDGTRVPILIGVAMLDAPVSIACIIDLTERKRTEAALRTTEEQLRQAQKMEAVGRLAGGVAHDFNNVLSVILSYAEMVMTDMELGDPRRDDIHEICLAGWRAAELTRQLLMFSRKQLLEPKILDLNTLMASMDKMLRRVLGEDVELVTRRAPGLGLVKADPSSLEQVILNLVVNARDAMPIGGTLTLATSNTIVEGVPSVLLSVTDTGIGIDAATQARMFEPFFTTKPKDKGTGLGLSTVFGIVQQSGGSVRVTSELGRGATFEIYLPGVAGAGAVVHPAGPRAATPARGSETILLVEDEAQVRAVAREILERHGYTVIEARDGATAIALGEQHHGTIDLLLTDVVMPHLSGTELVKRLAALRPDMRVLYMSGYTDDSIVRHGILSSDIAFLPKPLTPESLTRKVREVLDGG